jgi:hypothetical protein
LFTGTKNSKKKRHLFIPTQRYGEFGSPPEMCFCWSRLHSVTVGFVFTS